MSRRTRTLTLALGLGLLGATVAAAAVLAVSSARLTAVVQSYGEPVTCTLREGLLGTSPDAYVDESAAGTNFATADLLVQSRNGNRNKRAFIRFDLSACGISSAALVHSASLTLRMSSAPMTSRTYHVRRVTGSWTESGLTWTSQPGVAGVTASTSTGTATNVDLSWGVTVDVQAFVSGEQANNGWRISDSAESATSANTLVSTLRSSEFGTAAQRPRLVVVYSSPS